jgi:SAM-dependent methyltransferase
VFHHVTFGERPALVAEMRRVVRPGGLVVIIEHNPWNPLTRFAVARCPFDHDAVLLDWREAEARLTDGGISAPASEHFLLLPFAAGPADVIERSLGRLPFGAQYMTSGVVR